MRDNKRIISNRVKISKEKTKKELAMKTDSNNSNGKEMITPTSNSKTRKDSGKKTSITTKTKLIKKEPMELQCKLPKRLKSFILDNSFKKTTTLEETIVMA